jgi:hypothetical protein
LVADLAGVGDGQAVEAVPDYDDIDTADLVVDRGLVV